MCILVSDETDQELASDVVLLVGTWSGRSKLELMSDWREVGSGGVTMYNIYIDMYNYIYIYVYIYMYIYIYVYIYIHG